MSRLSHRLFFCILSILTSTLPGNILYTGQEQLPASAGFGGGEPTAAVDPSTKLYREIFVGNTSPEMTDEALKAFVGGALMQIGL